MSQLAAWQPILPLRIEDNPRSATNQTIDVDSRLLAARLWVTKMAMKPIGRALLWLTLFAPVFAFAQIDPVKRDLIQFGIQPAV